MLVKSVDMLCTKIEVREKKESKEKYLLISLLDLTSGDLFDLIEKDLSFLSSIKAMNKYNFDLKLSSSKYGLNLVIENVTDSLGEI